MFVDVYEIDAVEKINKITYEWGNGGRGKLYVECIHVFGIGCLCETWLKVILV